MLAAVQRERAMEQDESIAATRRATSARHPARIPEVRVPTVRGLHGRRGLALRIGLGMASICATQLASTVTVNPTHDISVVCEFSPPRFESGGGGTRVTIPGCDNWERVGEPTLPFRTVRLLLPPAAVVTGVGALADTPPTEIADQGRIEHGRIPVPFSGSSQTARAQFPTDQPDPAIYLSDAPFPAVRAELASVQRMGGYDIAFVRVHPIQYTPLSGRLNFAPRLRVTVTISAQTHVDPSLLHPRDPARARQTVAAMVENPDMMAAYASPALLSPLHRLSLTIC